MKQLKTGALIAMAVGGLFTAACEKKDEAAKDKPKAEQATDKKPGVAPAEAPATDEKTAQVDCGGVNACKGQGTCKTEKHGCGGQNDCKGQGVLTMSEADCKAKGGTITARK